MSNSLVNAQSQDSAENKNHTLQMIMPYFCCQQLASDSVALILHRHSGEERIE